MKKQYIKPFAGRLHLKIESLLYVMSIDYGGDGNNPGAPKDPTAREMRDRYWDDEPDNTERGSSFWDE